MARKKESLAQTVRGEFCRNLGWQQSHEGKLSQPRFYLGYDRDIAVLKASQLETIWLTVERTWRREHQPGKPVWTADTLRIAGAVCRGERTVLIDPRSDIDPERASTIPSETFAAYLQQLRQDFPLVDIHYCDDDLEERGMGRLDERAKQAEAVVNFMRPKPRAASQCLHAALDAFGNHLEQKYAGNQRYLKKLLDRINALKNQRERVPLSDVDCDFLDVWFMAWGARPTKPSGGLYARNTIRDIVKTLRNFIKWLHRDREWDWRLPEGWDMPRVRVKTLPEERAKRRALPKYKRAEIATLYECALPFERLLLLLGLNLGFGKGEIETLQLSEIEYGERSYIRRERTKTGVYGCWRLWPETVAGLRWYLDHVRPPSDSGYVFLSRKSRPLYEQTKGHNPNQRIPNTWHRLIKRVRKSHADFRPLSFNKLRKTSSSWIRKHFGGEIAAIFLSHGQATGDELLEEYAARDFGRLWRATDAYGRWLRKAWHVEDPFPPKNKGLRTVLPVRTIRRIQDLARQGYTPRKIAELTGASETTCKRYARMAKSPVSPAPTHPAPTSLPCPSSSPWPCCPSPISPTSAAFRPC